MYEKENTNQLHINFELTNNFRAVERKLTKKYGDEELNNCINQILSLIGYKYLSQNIKTDEDNGYSLNEQYHYENLLTNKNEVIETLKKGINQITGDSDNVHASDVFHDIFSLMDFEKYFENEEWLFFIELVELLGRGTTATLGQTFNFITQYPEKTKNNIYLSKPSEILAKVLALNHREVENFYDPYATNGSLMVAIGNKINVENYYGQHNEFDKYVLAKLNLLVNDINYKNIFVKHNDIASPNPWDKKKFDLSATIPDLKRKTIEISDDDKRFKQFSLKKSLEFAYLLDMEYNLDDEGSVGIIVPYGLLFRTGVERKIVKHLVNSQLISTIIGLPGGLFEDTSVPTALIILDKKPKDGIYYLNLDNGIKDNRGIDETLKLDGIEKYLSILAENKEVKFTSKLVTMDDIKENEYNLSINRYLDLKNLAKIDIGKTMDNIRILKNGLKELDEELNRKISDLSFN